MSTGTHKILRRTLLEYEWGIWNKPNLSSVDDRVCIQLFISGQYRNYREMNDWLEQQDPSTIKDEGIGIWWVDRKVLTMFMLKFGAGHGKI